MAAAEYYNASAAQTAPHHSPYQQSPYHNPHELNGSPVPHYNLPPTSQPSQRPPPYQAMPSENKPTVHFASSSSTPHLSRPSSSPNSHRPSFSNQPSSHPSQYLQPPPHHSAHGHNGPPQAAIQQPHLRPYMNGNQSQYSLNGGYSSDPESRRRRRHKHREQKDDRPSPREVESRTARSRSTNADGFLGAAGGGLIGDLIFPGLGTVGGVVAGWIGGRDYGKHRKHREDKLHRDQEEWEHRFRSRSNSDERKNDGREHHRTHSSHSRHKTDY